MKNIPFPNPHDADALNDYLDALAAGKQANPVGDVQATAAKMHALANQSLPSVPEAQSGSHAGGETMQTAAYSPPISNRTRRSRASTPKPSRLEPWLSGLLVAGLLISMVGYAWWNGPGGGDDNNNLAWAPGTAEALQQEPLNPESASWIADFDPADCTETSELSEVVIDFQSMPNSSPQGYAVVGQADTALASDAASQYRSMRACTSYSGAWAYWSEARIHEYPRALDENSSRELRELQQYFAGVYPQQFMAIGSDLNVGEDVQAEWDARAEANALGMPIPLDAKLNHEWAVELTDGRIAFPATVMYADNDPAILANGLPIDAPASTVVIVFAHEDGAWKYDDSLQLCMKNCLAGVGNPLDTTLEPWAQSTESKTCNAQSLSPDLEYGNDLSQIDFTSRQYTPVGTPAPSSVATASETINSWFTCEQTGDSAQKTDSYFSPLGQVGLTIIENGGAGDPFVAAKYLRQSETGAARLVSQATSWNQVVVLDEPIRTTQFDMNWTPMISGSSENVAFVRSTTTAFSPDTATELKDGRIAFYAVSTISSADRGAITYEGERTADPIAGVVMQRHGDLWLIDEVLLVDSGVTLYTPSDNWWWDARFDEQDLVWTQPISPAECPEYATHNAFDPDNPGGTQYTQEDYGQISKERDYEIVGPADPEDAAAVVTVVRQSYGCIAVGKSFPMVSARYEYENRTTAGRDSLATISDQRGEATDNISIWLETELGLTPVDMYVVQDPEDLTLDGSESLVTRGMYNPAYAVEFADGRIGIIPSAVSYTEFSVAINDQTVPGYGPNMIIFANVDGTWLLDESLPVCLGDCSEVPGATPFPGGDTIATPES